MQSSRVEPRSYSISVPVTLKLRDAGAFLFTLVLPSSMAYVFVTEIWEAENGFSNNHLKTAKVLG